MAAPFKVAEHKLDPSRSTTLPPKALISDSISEKTIDDEVGRAKIAAKVLRCLAFTAEMLAFRDIAHNKAGVQSVRRIGAAPFQLEFTLRV